MISHLWRIISQYVFNMLPLYFFSRGLEGGSVGRWRGGVSQFLKPSPSVYCILETNWNGIEFQILFSWLPHFVVSHLVPPSLNLLHHSIMCQQYFLRHRSKLVTQLVSSAFQRRSNLLLWKTDWIIRKSGRLIITPICLTTSEIHWKDDFGPRVGLAILQAKEATSKEKEASN